MKQEQIQNKRIKAKSIFLCACQAKSVAIQQIQVQTPHRQVQLCIDLLSNGKQIWRSKVPVKRETFIMQKHESHRDVSYNQHFEKPFGSDSVAGMQSNYVVNKGWVIWCFQGRSIIRYNQQTSPIIINYFSAMIYHHAVGCLYSPPLICDSRSDTSTQTDQHEHHSDLHSHLLTAEINKNITSKAKSSLCRNYMEKGFCPYGRKCQFAHGPQELRINMETNRSYKTKGCHAFAKKGYCLYGARCNFIHEQPQIQNTRQKWMTIYSNHRETMKAVQNRERSRLMQLLNK